ncbi:MAG: DUF58 domain-containing protein [Planctomycetota bacterium]
MASALMKNEPPIANHSTRSQFRWYHLITWPIDLILAVRKMATASSVALVLAFVMTLNVIWGYPWMGITAATLTMLVGGWMAQWLFRPRLELSPGVSAPIIAGQTTAFPITFRHQGRWSTFDIAVGPIGEHSSANGIHRDDGLRWQGRPRFISEIATQRSITIPMAVTASRRGEHSLPPLLVETGFPFGLLRYRRTAAVPGTIIATPEPIEGADRLPIRNAIDQINQWTQQNLHGESFDYIGSREYVAGMPVQRFDFRAWARTGTAAVREYHAPSLPRIRILIDPYVDSQTTVAFEWMLRVAATLVSDLHDSGFVTECRVLLQDESVTSGEDSLVSLALLQPIKVTTSQESMNQRMIDLLSSNEHSTSRTRTSTADSMWVLSSRLEVEPILKTHPMHLLRMPTPMPLSTEG